MDQRGQSVGPGRFGRSGLTLLLDAHLHAVATDGGSYRLAPAGLPGDSWVTSRPASVVDLIGDLVAAGVDGGVLVQPVGAYGFDNAYCLDACVEAAGSSIVSPRFAAQVVVDQGASDRVATLLGWADQGAGGVRFFDIPAAEPAWLGAPGFADVVEACLERGLRMSCCVLPDGLEAVGRLLDQVAGRVPVVLDHCGFVDLEGGGLVALTRLAGRGDLVVKVTSHLLAGLADPAATVSHLVATLGADHVCWGSDHPQHEGAYAAKVEMAREAASSLTPAQAEWFLSATTGRIWPELAD